MVQISLQNSGGKVVFLGGSMEPSWAPTGTKVPWSLLSVKDYHLFSVPKSTVVRPRESDTWNQVKSCTKHGRPNQS